LEVAVLCDVTEYQLTTPLPTERCFSGARPLLHWALPTFPALFKNCQWVESVSDQGFSYPCTGWGQTHDVETKRTQVRENILELEQLPVSTVGIGSVPAKLVIV